MTGPTPDTPREAEVRALFNTMSTEQQETLTAASGAIGRLQSKATALEAATVDDETFAEFNALASGMKADADAAQDAFAQIGVETPPAPPTAVPKAKKKK